METTWTKERQNDKKENKSHEAKKKRENKNERKERKGKVYIYSLWRY